MGAVGRPPVKGTSEHRQVGDRIRYERSSRGISRASVAAHLGIDVSVYAKIELGSVALTLEKADPLASFIGVPLSRLNAKLSATEAAALRAFVERDRRRRAA